MDRLKDIFTDPQKTDLNEEDFDEFEEELEDFEDDSDVDFEEDISDEELGLEEDSEDKEGIIVKAFSVEEGLEIAAKKFNVPITELEYEIIRRGSPGFFGIGKRPFVFKMYAPSVQETSLKEVPLFGEDFAGALQKINNVDGSFRIRITKKGILLKVTAPTGKGKKISVEDVVQALKDKNIESFSMPKIKEAVNKCDGNYVIIGSYEGIPSNDSVARVEISSDEMHAYIKIQPPQIPGGRALDEEEIVALLNSSGVVEGIKRDAILRALEEELYNQAVEVAEGIPPVNGEDAKFEYKFRTSTEDITLSEDEKGKVDYHNLNLVENVVIGQVLAEKIPATKGIPGKTVTGKILPATDGKDIPLPIGKNVKVSDDGTKVISEINGQVILVKGLIQVEPILEVPGDVKLTTTGNIVFLGSVLVRGNVDDTMSIKAAGNIDIRGSVGNAILEAEQDIFLRQGLAGKDKAQIIAGHDIYAKFIEHAQLVKAENDIVVSEGLMYCKVRAGKRVVCNGKRGMIVGGEIMAGEEVNAKTIGSQSYTETLIEVGIDPKSREEQLALEEERRNLKDALREISLNITTLTEQKKHAKGNLPPEKEELLMNLTTQRDEKTARLNEVEARIGQIKTYLDTLEAKGKVAVQKTVFPKVKIMVRNAGLEVKDEFNYVTFVQEAGNIKILPYEDTEVKSTDSLTRRRR